MNPRIHTNLSDKLSQTSLVGRSSIALVVLAVGGLAGCASASDASAQPTTPATQAAAIARTECGPAYRDDAQVAEILTGALVEGTSPLYGGIESNRSHQRLEGAAIRVRPMKGTSAEWLARALTCHGAEQTLAQGPARTVASDPFYLPGALPQIHVRSAGDAFEVEVTAERAQDATEILARARTLAGVPGVAQISKGAGTSEPVAVDLSR